MHNYEKQFRKIWATIDKAAEERRQAEIESRQWRAKHEEDRREWQAKREEDERKWRAKREEDERKWQAKREEDERKWRAKHEEDKRELNESLKKVSAQIGGFTQNDSEALEQEFANAVRDGMKINGNPFNNVYQGMRFKHEFDIIAVNCASVAVGEIKHKLLPDDVDRFFKERLPFFEEEWLASGNKEFDGKKVFGMVGGKVVTADAVKKAREHGMFVLRLKNKAVVVGNSAYARPFKSSGSVN